MEESRPMERDEIIKAWECCISDKCEFCPYAGMPTTIVTCGLFAKGKAIALIKELTEENERLKAEIKRKTLIITKKEKE